MADVSNVNLIRSDRVENEITQTGSDNYACVRFVRFSSLKWIVGQFPRTFDKTSDKTRGDIRAVLADISVNLSKVALISARTARISPRVLSLVLSNVRGNWPTIHLREEKRTNRTHA